MPRMNGELCFLDQHCMSGSCFFNVCMGPTTIVGRKGSTCSADDQCLGDLFCLDDVCSMPGNDGDKCYRDDQCMQGLTCEDCVCTREMTEYGPER